MADVLPAALNDVAEVARNMREWDKREIYATRWEADPQALARDCMSSGDFAYTFWYEGAPIAAMGLIPMHPGVWNAWMFATDEFPKIGLMVTKFAKRVLFPSLLGQRAHRIFALSMVGHEDAQRWLVSLGAKPEARLANYGKGREDFVVYAWSR